MVVCVGNVLSPFGVYEDSIEDTGALTDGNALFWWGVLGRQIDQSDPSLSSHMFVKPLTKVPTCDNDE